MKKKGGGTLAGIPRASGERNSPVGNGATSSNQVSSFSLLHYPTHPCIDPFHHIQYLVVLELNFDAFERYSMRFHPLVMACNEQTAEWQSLHSAFTEP